MLSAFKNKEFKNAASIDNLSESALNLLNSQFRVDDNGISKWNKSQIEAKANAIGLTDSLKNEILTMAQDADITDRLKTGKLTWGKAIAVSGDDIDKVADALKQSGKISEDWIERLNNVNKTNLKQTVLDAVNATDGLADSIANVGKVADDTGLLSKAGTMGKGILAGFKEFASTGVGKLTIAATAISAAITAFKFLDDKFDITFDTAFKHTSEGVSNVQNLKSEIDSLTSQTDQHKQTLSDIASSNNIDISGLDSVDDIVNRINSVGGISLVDQTEVDKISEANSSLERTLELKKLSLTSEQKETADKAKKTLKKSVDAEATSNDYLLRSKYESNFVGSPDQTKYKSGNIIKSTTSDIKAIESYKKKIASLQKAQIDAMNDEGNSSDKKKGVLSSLKNFFTKKDSEKLQDQIDDYNDAMDDIQSDISDKQSTLL